MHRRVAVAGDVLNAGPQLVRVPDTRHCAVVADPEQDLAAEGIRQGHQLAGEGRRQPFLELERRAFAFLDQDIEVGRGHDDFFFLHKRSTAANQFGHGEPSVVEGEGARLARRILDAHDARTVFIPAFSTT